MNEKLFHIPVMKNEVLKLLRPQKGKRFIDATAGGGGHSKYLSQLMKKDARLLAVEKDPVLVNALKKKMTNKGKKVVVVQGDYVHLDTLALREGFAPADGILFDLGMSSWHLEHSGRGFSFQKNEDLDMRFDPGEGMNAREIVAYSTPQELEKILFHYGEERFARRIARAIVEARKRKEILTTNDLVDVIRRALPKTHRYGSLHFATRVFQALRIFVNRELDALASALPKAFALLRSDGRLVVISFHSLEDRIVKKIFRVLELSGDAKLLTPKPLMATSDEVGRNPRARSAKMRVLIKKTHS